MLNFSISLKVFSITPAHVTFYVYTGMLREGQRHTDITRGSAGQLTMRLNEFQGFVCQLKPPIISIDNPEENPAPDFLHELYAYEKARGDWDFPKYLLK